MSGTECSRLASALPLPSLTNQQQGGIRGWEGARFKEALTVSITQVPILHALRRRASLNLECTSHSSPYSWPWPPEAGSHIQEEGAPSLHRRAGALSLATLGPLCSP